MRLFRTRFSGIFSILENGKSTPFQKEKHSLGKILRNIFKYAKNIEKLWQKQLEV